MPTAFDRLAGAGKLPTPPSRGSQWSRPGGRPCCWNKAGGAARASRCGWRRAGSVCEQGAAAREARGRPAGTGAPAAAAACVGGEQPGTAGVAVAMAVAVGRPSVSAGASLPQRADPGAPGGLRFGALAGGDLREPEGGSGWWLLGLWVCACI